MTPKSTFLLKAAIIFIGMLVLTLCGFILADIIKGWDNTPADMAAFFYPIMVIIYISAIPFFVALSKSFKLLTYVDKNIAFSDLSVESLKEIKYCAITIAALYVVSLPFLFQFAQQDDAPGLIMLGMIVVFASGVIATFTAVLEKLLYNAIEIKKENDLTV